MGRLADTWDLGRDFSKKQEIVRTIQIGMARMIPYAAMSSMNIGTFKGRDVGRGSQAAGGSESGEYEWGPQLPTWGEGLKGGYVNKLLQGFFQYYEGGTDYWGNYHRHYGSVWGDAARGKARDAHSAGWPNLYRAGGAGKISARKFIGMTGKEGGITEKDLTFQEAEIGGRLYKWPANPKLKGVPKKKWGSAPTWWSKYGDKGVIASEKAVQGLWTAFLEAAAKGDEGQAPIELSKSTQSKLLTRALKERQEYKVWNPTSKAFVSIAESAGEVDLSMIIREGVNDKGNPELVFPPQWQMINSNPHARGSDKLGYKSAYNASYGKDGDEWLSGKRKDLDFSVQFAEGTIMRDVLAQKLGMEFKEDFAGFEVSMFDVTHESRILHFAKDTLKGIQDIGPALEKVTQALNDKLGAAGQDMGPDELRRGMQEVVKDLEKIQVSKKKTLTGPNTSTIGGTAILTGVETQQIFTRLTTQLLSQMDEGMNPSGPKTTSYTYEAGLTLGTGKDAQTYSVLIDVGVEADSQGNPNKIYTRLHHNGAVEIAAGRRGIREVIGQSLFGTRWTAEYGSEFIERAAITYWMSKFDSENIGKIFEVAGGIAAEGRAMTPEFAVAAMTGKDVAERLIRAFKAYETGNTGGDTFTSAVEHLTKQASKAWRDKTHWSSYQKAMSGPVKGMFYKQSGYGSNPVPPEQGLQGITWGSMANKNFFPTYPQFVKGNLGLKNTEGGIINPWAAVGVAGGEAAATPTSYTGGGQPLWAAPFFTAARKQLTEKDMRKRLDL